MAAQKGKASGPTAKRAPPPIPRLESTYSVIIHKAISAAKARTGLTQRIRNATRELAAMVPHTRERFRGMSLGGKIVTVLILLAVGAALALAGIYALGRRDPSRLRAAIQMRLRAGDYVGAKDLLTELRQTEAITDTDRLQLVTAVEAGMNKLRSDLQKRVDEQKSTGHYDKAIINLDTMERAGFSGEWMLFTRADLLRQSGRGSQAQAFFLRYAELYRTSDKADDALFWAADIARHEGDKATARRLLDRLLSEYPGSNFKASAHRILTEIE